jgi:hypothetical protein
MRTAIGMMLIGLGLAGTNTASATEQRDEPAVAVRIHDYAHVAPASLADAQRLVAAFYGTIGVRIEWAATVQRSTDDDENRSCGPTEDLTVIVLNGRMSEREPLPSRFVLGFAPVARQGGGRVAYVVYDRVDAVAADSARQMGDLLSLVIAHEIGHLLLPVGSHSPQGLMRGDWNVNDLRQTDLRVLGFTPQQATLIRESLGASSPVGP